jgi:hypothetical protein
MLIDRITKWFSKPQPKIICLDDNHFNLADKIIELEEKYSGLLLDVKRLEEENIETSNCLYELMNSIDAVDARIDILTAEKWIDKNV